MFLLPLLVICGLICGTVAGASQPDLAAGLRNPNPSVRSDCLKTIAAQGGEEWLHQLNLASRAKEATVRAAASTAIGAVLHRSRPDGFTPTDERHVVRLIELLEDADSIVTASATEALRLISGMDLDSSPAQWQAWWEDSAFLRNAGQARIAD